MMVSPRKVLQCTLLLSVLLVSTGPGVWGEEKINFVSPNRAGVNGQTRITLHGADFPVDLHIGDTKPRKEVYFINSFTEYPCDVHQEESDETQIVCYTRPMEEDRYYVKLRLNNKWLDSSKYCYGNPSSHRCSLCVRHWYTPLIQSLDWVTNPAQEVLTIRGRLLTNLTSSAEAEATNGNTDKIARVYLTSGVCNIFKDVDEPYGVLLDNDGESNWGTLACKVDSQFVGNQNVSFIVTGDHGRSLPYPSTFHVSALDKIYMFQTFAVVEDVNPKQGSIEGGSMLTITGKYFDNSTRAPIKVLVGGEECSVQSVSDTQIKCLTSAQPAARSLYPGGRGFRHEVFPNQNDINADLESSQAGVWTFHTDGSETSWAEGDNLVVRTQGFFIPYVTANHKFKIKGDDQVDVYLNKNGNDPTGKELIISSSSNHYATSGSIALTKGEEYYVEIRHQEHTSTQKMKMAVYVDRTNYTPDQTSSALTDVQTISIGSTVVQEKQVITFEEWETQEPSPSEWAITVSCLQDSCDGYSFKITIFGVNTDAILSGASSTSVKSALSAITSDVDVSGDATNGYTITFTTTTGRVELSATSSDESAMTVTASESVVGVPDLNSFTFKINGFVSDPVTFQASDEDVASAIKSLFGPKCPKQIENDLGANIMFYHDFETTGFVSGLRSSETAFCGIYSAKNPDYVFYTTDAPFSSATYQKLCFAYVGDISNSILVSYNYLDSETGEKNDVNFWRTINNVGFQDATEWTHVCVDIDDLLTSAEPSQSNFDVYALRLNAGSNNNVDLYVDNVMVASDAKQTSEEILSFTRSIRPSAEPEIRLSDVTVTKADASNSTFLKYDVIFHPIECGHNFPLLGFASSSGTVNADDGLYGTDWASTSRIRVERTATASPPVKGTFDISFEGGSHGGLQELPANVSNEDLATQLESLIGITTTSVQRSGSCYGYTYQVKFISPGGKYDMMKVDGSALTGNSPTISATQTVEGGLLMDPIRGDFFRTAHATPQVQIFVNDIPSHCSGLFDTNVASSCEFQWLSSETPQVTNVDPTSGAAGAAIEITGERFGSNNNIIVGGVECSVTESSETLLRCTLGNSPGGQQTLAVNVGGKGLATVADGYKTFTVTSEITSISPTSGSVAGCTTVSISGTGFDTTSTVSIGGNGCDVTAATYSSITCVTSASATESTLAVSVITSGVAATGSVTYSYVTTGTGSINGIAPATVGIGGGTEITVSGENFGSVTGSVQVGSEMASVLSWNDTTIVFSAPSISSGTYNVHVIIDPVGCAISSSNGSRKRRSVQTSTISYIFNVTLIEPRTGSFAGGTTVKLKGKGFTDSMKIFFGKFPCSTVPDSVTATSVTCVTKPPSSSYIVTNRGRHPKFGIGYAWDPKELSVVVGDNVTFQWSVPKEVEGLPIGLFTTINNLGITYDGQGFEVGAAVSGSLSYRFTKPGVYYYGSGCVIKDADDCNLFMRGSVHVANASVTKDLIVNVANESTNFLFTFDQAATPTITSIEPLNGTTETDITITGTLFKEPTVEVGNASCVLNANNAVISTKIVCRISAEGELPVGFLELVTVNEASFGYARNEIMEAKSRRFLLLPLMTSVSPTSGSRAGGTTLKITGSGFSSSSAVTIRNGDLEVPCVVQNATYKRIICKTSPAPSGRDYEGEVVVSESNLLAKCSSPCNFKFAEAETPEVTGVNIARADYYATTTLTLSGENFGDDSSKVHVAVGDAVTYDCVVRSVSDTKIQCVLSRFAVGKHSLSVHVSRKGNAIISSGHDTLTNPAVIFSVTPSQGSVHGGTSITISGNGFVSGVTIVKVGGMPCNIISISFHSVVCSTKAGTDGTVDVEVKSRELAYPVQSYTYSDAESPAVTSVTPLEGTDGDTITVTGSGFGSDADAITVKVGGVVCNLTTPVTDTSVECALGSGEGGAAPVQVCVSGKGRSNEYSGFSYTFHLTTVNPSSGSYGGSQTVTVNGSGFSRDSKVKICSQECSSQKYVSTNAIECTTPEKLVTDQSETQCDVEVFNGEDSVPLAAGYTYRTDKTPFVNKVSPSEGGTGGGTNITISGSNLQLGGDNTTVTINGSNCNIIRKNESEIICTTNSHRGSLQTEVKVHAGSCGISPTEKNASFYYIDRWSSNFTWGRGPIPQEGEFIIIPKGHTVLLDTQTPILKMLLIDGGKVIFKDSKDETMILHAENVLITNGGVLEIGTEERPYAGKAIIEMHGHLRSPELPIYGAKTLGLRNGTLDLHGRHIPYTWTKLSETAEIGSTQIKLQHSVNWLRGDLIVIASTGLRHSQRENELLAIAAVSEDRRTLTLNGTLKYKHLGTEENFGAKTVQFRAEVGLLSRNIVFRGSNDQLWHDDIPACADGFDTGMFATQTCFQGRFGEEIGSDQFGGSIMIHAKDSTSNAATARIEYVEVNYAGQAFRLGRYPIHWHLMGNVSGMYVRGCAIHQTFNRAVTIHGTHNLVVERNVIYNVMGGAIFIEDGIETKNIIQYNLAVFVKQSTSLLNDDVTPAAYWITNPDNVIRHNHAAGGTHFGFWYRMHEHPDGPSFDPNICQQKVELGEFVNNTVHSQGWFGLWIFQSYFPVEGGRCDGTVPSPAKFYSLTTWNCEKGAEWVNCGAIQFHDFVMVNNEFAGIEMKLIKGTPWGEDKGALVKNAVIVGRNTASPAQDGSGIILPFSPGLLISGAKFFNFDGGSGGCFGVTSITGTCGFKCGGFYYWTEDLEFRNVKRKVIWRWKHEGVIEDRDGTLTGDENFTKVVPHSNLVPNDTCKAVAGDEFSSSAFQSAICQPGVRFHRFAISNVLPSSLEANNIMIKNRYGREEEIYLKKRLTHKPGWMVLLTSKEKHEVWFKDGEQFTNITYQSRYYDLLSNDYLFVKHKFLQKPDRIQMNNGDAVEVGVSEPLTSESNNLDWHYDSDTGEFEYIVSGKRDSRKRRAAIEIVDDRFKHVSVSPRIYRCFNPDCIESSATGDASPLTERPDKFFRWNDTVNPCLIHNATTNDIRVESKIPGTEDLCWVVVDVDNITEYDSITIHGVLQFVNDTKVSAIRILVLGGRLIAGFSGSDHFKQNLEIELRGKHDTPGLALPGIEVGSKALGCFGGCDLHGKPHDVYWTHLNNTADIGDTTIVLQKAVDWEDGSEVVITTTGYSSNETEKHVIKSIEGGTTIVLEKPLAHRHLGETVTVGNFTYQMRAEVGLLTRNIKITGQWYDEIDSEAFGARVLVGKTSVGTETLRGWARISNVEFFRTGQEGWTERWDPRFSLAWVNTGPHVDKRPSYVNCSAFHDGYSTAIGLFGASGIAVLDNVVHRTIHDGIRVTGSKHRLERNLVTKVLFRGTYGDRFETTNFKDWQANFEISEATNLILKDNVAAGGERLCFHMDGEACDAPDETAWSGNVAHGCLHGVQIFLEDGVNPCSMIRNFVIYKAWDYGIYHQTQTSVIVRNTVIADSTVAYLPLIYGPAALSHEYVDKSASMENVLCVGRSGSFDPVHDFMDENNDKNLIVRRQSPSKKAPLTPSGGKTCVMLPLFQSSTNGAPFKAFHGNNNYPTIRGLLNITGLTACDYKRHSDGTRDLVFFTNPANEDAFHPTHLRQITLENVETASKIHYARPSLKKINPSDCVDMECDAKKKVLVKDFDGTFLGGVGAVIPQAEFGWDVPGEVSRGLGDYRIPKAMLTSVDGKRINVSDIAAHQGIIRSTGCSPVRNWQAYDCHGDGALDYRMLVIESMDNDTETRRLSPVALLGDGYIDLNNGPQDHGWCFGYTCQKRISTFYTIVATGKSFEIFFTGYAPRTLRFHLLNVDETATVRLVIWYPRPERLDVYQVESKAYIHPENAYYDVKGGFWSTKSPSPGNPDQYKPAIDSQVHGANYMERTTRQLYITIRGPKPVEIRTAPMVVLQFAVAAVTVDDFFERNLIGNLATFLNVPESKLRVVDVAREVSEKKRRDLSRHARSTETFTYTIEFGDEIRNITTNTTELTAEMLNNKTDEILLHYLVGDLGEILNTSVISFGSSTAATDSTTNITDNIVFHKVPTDIQVQLSTTVEEYSAFPSLPTATLLDSAGDAVTSLAGEWVITVSMDKSAAGANNNATLLGDTSVTINSDGSAVFSNLMISHAGTGYVLRFEISTPAAVSIQSHNVTVDVTLRTVSTAITSGIDRRLPHGDDVLLGLQLQDSQGNNLQNVGYKDHTWKADVTLDDETLYGDVSVSGTTSFTFDSNGFVETTGLKLKNTKDYDTYGLSINVYTDPELYQHTRSAPVTFYDPSNNLHESPGALKTFRLSIDGDMCAEEIRKKLETYLQNSLNDHLANSAYFSSVTVTACPTSDEAISSFSARSTVTLIEIDIIAANATSASLAQTALLSYLSSSSYDLSFKGQALTLSSDCSFYSVNGGNAICLLGTLATSTTTSTTKSTTTIRTTSKPLTDGGTTTTPADGALALGGSTWTIIGVALGVATVLAAGAIGLACYLKRSPGGKVQPSMCVGGSQASLGSGPLINNISGSTPSPDGLGSSRPSTGNGMTPVHV